MADANRNDLGEQLASLNVRDYVSIAALREDLSRMVGEYCAVSPEFMNQAVLERCGNRCGHQSAGVACLGSTGSQCARARFDDRDPEKPARGVRTDGVGSMVEKKPVVASAVGGIPNQVIHKQTGLLAHFVEGAAYQIRFLLSHPEIAAKLGESGHRHAKENF